MVNPTPQNIKFDVGSAWDSIDGTTTTIVRGIIKRAQGQIRVITGTTTGPMQDEAVRSLADAFTVQNAMAGLGPESVNTSAIYENMKNQFIESAQNMLKVKGYTLDGKHFKFVDVNQ